MGSEASAETHTVSPEEIAKLWMSENAVVNQKTNYLLTATAFLSAVFGVALVEGASVRPAAYVVVVCGIIFTSLMLSSITRTCVYREHLRKALTSRSNDYRRLLTPEDFPLYAIRSSVVLKLLPGVLLVVWVVLLVHLVSLDMRH
ncbi:hypothetical protein SB751_20120 [Cupriavidus sp. SIMBA_020]|uniref:hypothetical protein n=1 Tax=Cupriavidus sp. SIMBA_020 TaxID=3085766 RepID=UPI00397A12FC